MISFKEFITEMNEADWDFKEVGVVDGKAEGMGGTVDILKGTHFRTKKEAWFIRPSHTGNIRMVTSDHKLVLKLTHPDKKKQSKNAKAIGLF
jgi:hypothetical protein